MPIHKVLGSACTLILFARSSGRNVGNAVIAIELKFKLS